jgi:hypothetical protein
MPSFLISSIVFYVAVELNPVSILDEVTSDFTP